MLLALAAGCANKEDTLPPDRKVTYSFSEASVRSVLIIVAKEGDLNIVVSPEVSSNITLIVRDVPARKVVEDIARTLGYTAKSDRAGIICVMSQDAAARAVKSPWGETVEPGGARVSYAFSEANIGSVLEIIAKEAGVSLMFGPEVNGTVTMRVIDVHWYDVVDAVTKTLGYVAELDGGTLRIRAAR